MKRALISVSDKTGVVAFAQGLVALGFEIVSTGGTAAALKEAGVDVIGISEVTHFPEILDGRVKTLHPRIHAGLLAKNEDAHMAVLQAHEITPIDLVAVNLYPFEKTVAKAGVTLDEAIENIDIGGPSMIRAAAKNMERVAVVVSPEQYPMVLEALEKGNGELSLNERQALALAAFQHTARYDAAISTHLRTAFEAPLFAEEWSMGGRKRQSLRYGENPHQEAAFYQIGETVGTVAAATQLAGKALSYNNIVDLDAAWQLVNEFADAPAVAIIKHTNPCGFALGESIADAYARAHAADPLSAFGGIIAANRPVDAAMAELVVQTFMEAVIAPGFSAEAVKIFAEKPNLRLLDAHEARQTTEPWVESISGGFLIQARDTHQLDASSVRCVTKRSPDEGEMRDLLFAWKVVKHVKSNAIVVAKDAQTLGVGAGQMNRVGACDICFKEAGEKAKGAVLASDAFFPFSDSIEAAAAAGITAIIQPGGSIRDEESIEAADRAGIAMLFTGVRHFRH